MIAELKWISADIFWVPYGPGCVRFTEAFCSTRLYLSKKQNKTSRLLLCVHQGPYADNHESEVIVVRRVDIFVFFSQAQDQWSSFILSTLVFRFTLLTTYDGWYNIEACLFSPVCMPGSNRGRYRLMFSHKAASFRSDAPLSKLWQLGSTHLWVMLVLGAVNTNTSCATSV